MSVIKTANGWVELGAPNALEQAYETDGHRTERFQPANEPAKYDFRTYFECIVYGHPVFGRGKDLKHLKPWYLFPAEWLCESADARHMTYLRFGHLDRLLTVMK